MGSVIPMQSANTSSTRLADPRHQNVSESVRAFWRTSKYFGGKYQNDKFEFQIMTDLLNPDKLRRKVKSESLQN